MRRATLIYNPCAGRRQAERRLAGILDILRQGGFAVEAEPTGGPGDAAAIARERASAGVEVVFALGGDGTLREAASGLLGTDTALAPLPGGTSNVVAHSLGLPRDPREAARLLAGLAPRPMDVGLCGDEPFLMQASAGLDAAVLARLDPARKRRLGRAAVVLAGLGELTRYDYPEVLLRADGETLVARFLAVCNLPHYAGPFRLAPGARCDDRRLDLVTARRGGALATLGFAVALAAGRHLARRDVALRRVEQVEIEAPATLPLQIDGDPLPAPPPLVIRLAPVRLRVLAPADPPQPPARG